MDAFYMDLGHARKLPLFRRYYNGCRCVTVVMISQIYANISYKTKFKHTHIARFKGISISIHVNMLVDANQFTSDHSFENFTK